MLVGLVGQREEKRGTGLSNHELFFNNRHFSFYS